MLADILTLSLFLCHATTPESSHPITEKMSNTILASLDLADLQNHGLVAPGPTGGSHRLHKRRLNRSSDEEHKSIPLDISPDSPDAGDAFVSIPAAIISLESLSYIGLSDETADKLWSEWTNWPATGPGRETDPDDGYGLQVSFIDYIIGHLKSQGTDTNNDDDNGDDVWRASLGTFGLHPSVIDAIMDPTFQYLRKSESCWHWVRDTIEMRYYGLHDIQRASSERKMALQRASARPSTSSAGDVGTSLAGSRRSVSGLQQQSIPGTETVAWGSAIAIAARNAPGKTILYKGLDQARIPGLFNENGALAHIERLASASPIDFSGSRALYYFTPDWKVAEHYAAYCKRRADPESVVIISIEIPNAAIDSLPASQVARLYWPDPEWKELVWHSRNRASLPTHMRHYRDKFLIIGSTSRRPNSYYHQLASWEEIGENCLRRIGISGLGRIAIQYVFSLEDGSDFLHEHGTRSLKVWLYSYTDLEAWLEENAL